MTRPDLRWLAAGIVAYGLYAIVRGWTGGGLLCFAIAAVVLLFDWVRRRNRPSSGPD